MNCKRLIDNTRLYLDFVFVIIIQVVASHNYFSFLLISSNYPHLSWHLSLSGLMGVISPVALHSCTSAQPWAFGIHLSSLSESLMPFKVQGHKGNPPIAHSKRLTHRAWGAVVHLSDLVEHHILDEHGDGLQDKWHKQMHVDVVPRAVQLPRTHGMETRMQVKPRDKTLEFNKEGFLCLLPNVHGANSLKWHKS